MRRAITVHTRGHWPEDAAVDSVTLAYLDRHRRRIRLVADSGTPFLLDLPRAQHLTEGDGLELDNGGYMRVRAAPEPVIEVVADSPTDLLRVAWHLGNRHLPLQVLEDRLRLRADHVIAAMVEGLGGRVTWAEAPFDPEIGAYAGDPAALTAANRLGLAFRATAELALESAQQGEAFLSTCVIAWPDPFLAQWADEKNPSPPFRGEREGPVAQRREGEVGDSRA